MNHKEREKTKKKKAYRRREGDLMPLATAERAEKSENNPEPFLFIYLLLLARNPN